MSVHQLSLNELELRPVLASPTHIHMCLQSFLPRRHKLELHLCAVSFLLDKRFLATLARLSTFALDLR